MTLTLTIWDMIALGAVMLVGLPHGAFDGAIAVCLGFGRTGKRIAGFISMYLLLAGLAVMVWAQSAVFALALFLLMTIIHFGAGDIPAANYLKLERTARLQRGLLIYAHGCLIPVLLPLAHEADVQRLFSALAGPNAVILFDGLVLLGAFWIISLLIYGFLALSAWHLRMPLAEILLLSAMLFIVPPLVGFALYFCLVHSRRHFVSVWTALCSFTDRAHIIATAAALTLVTWAGAGVFFTLQMSGGPGNADIAALRTVFILLAALTVPHMILVDWMFRPATERLRADG